MPFSVIMCSENYSQTKDILLIKTKHLIVSNMHVALISVALMDAISKRISFQQDNDISLIGPYAKRSIRKIDHFFKARDMPQNKVLN